MKKLKFLNILGFTALAFSGLFLVNSCSKSDSGSVVSAFVGNWSGTACNGNTNMRIDKASSNYTMNVTCTIGTDSCQQQINLLATVSSTDLNNFSMNLQNFTDKCGNSYTLSGGATLTAADTLLLTLYTQSAKTGISACTFKAAKVK